MIGKVLRGSLKPRHRGQDVQRRAGRSAGAVPAGGSLVLRDLRWCTAKHPATARCRRGRWKCRRLLREELADGAGAGTCHRSPLTGRHRQKWNRGPHAYGCTPDRAARWPNFLPRWRYCRLSRATSSNGSAEHARTLSIRLWRNRVPRPARPCRRLIHRPTRARYACSTRSTARKSSMGVRKAGEVFADIATAARRTVHEASVRASAAKPN